MGLQGKYNNNVLMMELNVGYDGDIIGIWWGYAGEQRYQLQQDHVNWSNGNIMICICIYIYNRIELMFLSNLVGW